MEHNQSSTGMEQGAWSREKTPCLRLIERRM